ncbi:MAG: GAF domain-containing protein, partial [Deltaproteobacteria bacterium]|nr:GAF domain-containing protein [Deltaproteobacteria bacterium]
IITEQAYSYLHAGASRAAIAHVRANLDQLERTNNLMFRYNTASVLYAELMVTGETAAAAQLWARLEQQYQPLSRTIYVRLARVIAMLEVLLDQGETGPAVDATIAEFRELLSEDYYSNAARMLAGYARLAQLEKAAAGERRAARRRLEQVARELSLRALVPVFQCHPPVWRAALARMDGRFAKARRLLERADRLATRCQSRRAGFYIALERARLDRATGGATARFHAQAALEIARSEGWPKKIARLREEFGLVEEQRQAAANPALALTTVSSLSAEQARRYADALLQVCLASATTLDGDVLARNALVEVARVLGAERALFFLADPASGELALKASTGADSATISRTVVQRVAASRKPLVLTGTDEGEALGSQSILAHGLRSIIAAPLMMRERLIGVVYLDSRLAKGIFTEKDLDLLLGISHHIAIAIETARMARLEAERSALRRDMELLGAVQSLLLPRDPAFSTGRLRCVSFYQPATNCGGDWWWYERLPEGALLLLVGDVSGHGAGPAMITAAIAGAFRSQWDSGGAGDPLRLLQALDRQVRSFGRGVHMTLSLLRVDPLRQEIRWWSAAAPPIFVLGRDGATCLAQQGTMLGSEGAFHAPEKSLAFLPGDRLLVCTDGLLELREPGGRELGARRVAKLLSATRATPLQRLPELLREEIGSFQGNRPQDDDITFVMIEADEPARTAEMGLPIQQEENSP